MTAPGRNILLIANNFPPLRGGSVAVYENIARHSGGRLIAMAPRDSYIDGLPIIGWREHDRRANYRTVRPRLLRTLLVRDGPAGMLAQLRFLAKDLALRARLAWRIGALLREARIGAVCIGELIASGWIIRLLHRFTRVRTAIYVHGEEILTEEPHDPQHRRSAQVLMAADRIFVVSPFAGAAVQSLIGAAHGGKIRLIENGVDTALFRPEARRPELVEAYGLAGCFVFVTVCRLLEKKGVDMAIAAFARVLARHPDSRFVVVGSGPYEGELHRQAGALGLGGKVIFAGNVLPADLVAHYCLGDVFVMPNRALANGDTEGFGLVFLEANACGLPVIGGRDGGTAAAVRDGENGLLVDGKSEDGIADAMLRLREDAALRARIGASGRRIAVGSGWEAKATAFMAACLEP